MKPKVLVMQARGSNRDLDVMAALSLAGADPCAVPLNHLRQGRRNWQDFQMLVVPGGFSYADALGAGKLLALDLKSYFAGEMTEFVGSGRLVLGICNGFQALVKAGILPGDGGVDQSRNATLTFNASGHFECRWVQLKPMSQVCHWTQGLEALVTCPVAHGEGNFQVADDKTLVQLQADDQVAFQYCQPDGSPAQGKYPLNPNGSRMDIAGVCNPQGNVLGLMPHPENHIHDQQHPQWTRGGCGQSGLSLFVNGVRQAAGM